MLSKMTLIERNWKQNNLVIQATLEDRPPDVNSGPGGSVLPLVICMEYGAEWVSKLFH